MSEDDELNRRVWLYVALVGSPIFAVLAFARTVLVEDAPASDAVTAAATIAAFFVLRSLWFLWRAPR